MNIASKFEGVSINQPDFLRWLSSCFASEVRRDAMVQYHAGAAEPIMSYVERIGAGAAAQGLRDVFAGWDEPDLRSQELSLRADFAALFLLGSPKMVSPYASVYAGDGLLMGAPHDRMVQKLRRCQLVLAGNGQEPADHLAAQLEYLALCYAGVSGAEKATQFIRDELAPWVPAFAEKLRHSAVDSPFYFHLADVLEQFVASASRT